MNSSFEHLGGADTAYGAMLSETEREDLEARAACLINPASGIANDYLNVFNEILLLIENLPVLLPEMVDELMEWRPRTYRGYFASSPLPGGAYALARYDALDDDFRRQFEAIIAELNKLAVQAIETIVRHRSADGEINPDDIAAPCEALSAEFRQALSIASDMVNNGNRSRTIKAQDVADRILIGGDR